MEKKKIVRSNFGTRGWLLILAGFLGFFACSIIPSSSLNILVPMFVEKFGWEASTLFVISSISGYLSIIGTIILAFLMKKTSVRFTVVLSAIGLGVCCGLWAFVQTTTQYLILMVVIVFFCDGVGGFGIPQLLAHWFPRKAGLANGWATMGGDCAGSLVSWLLLGAVAIGGWHGPFFAMGAIALIAGLLVLFFVKDYPEQCGCFPDNDPTTTPEEARKIFEQSQKYLKTSPWTVKKLLRTKQVWGLGLGIGFIIMAGGGIMGQLMICLTSRGIDQTTAALMFSVLGLVAVAGSYLIGLLDDRFGTIPSTLMLCGLTVVGLVLLAIPSRFAAWPAVILCGIFVGASNNLMGSLTNRVFGRYDQQAAMAVIYPIHVLIRSSAMGFTGLMVAWTGSYTWPFLINAVIVAIVGFVFSRMDIKCIGRTDEDIAAMEAAEKENQQA